MSLNPAGSSTSYALSISGGQQGGYAIIDGAGRPGIWTGTAQSWVDLTPAGASLGQVSSVHGGQQAGYVLVGSVTHAGVWSGTAASWVDLHAFLPQRFVQSYALGIVHDAGVTYVVGWAYDPTLNRDEAIMWANGGGHVNPLSFTVFRGVLESGDLASLLDSDNNYVVVRNGITALGTESPIMVRVSGQSPLQTPTTFQFTVENKVSITGLNQLIDLYDYALGRFVNADVRAASTNDAVVTVTGSVANVETGTRNVQSQIQVRPAGPLFTNTWRSYLDQTIWVIA